MDNNKQQTNVSGLIECPTCKTSGYINETYVTISELNKQKAEHEKTVKNLLKDLEYSRNRVSRLSFWDNNKGIVGWIIAAVIIISVSFAISMHEYEPSRIPTIGEKIARCSSEHEVKTCSCISSYLGEITEKEQREALAKSVESCYQEFED